MVKKEGIIKGRHDAGGHFKRVKEGWCRRTLKRRDDAGGRYKRER